MWQVVLSYRLRGRLQDEILAGLSPELAGEAGRMLEVLDVVDDTTRGASYQTQVRSQQLSMVPNGTCLARLRSHPDRCGGGVLGARAAISISSLSHTLPAQYRTMELPCGRAHTDMVAVVVAWTCCKTMCRAGQVQPYVRLRERVLWRTSRSQAATKLFPPTAEDAEAPLTAAQAVCICVHRSPAAGGCSCCPCDCGCRVFLGLQGLYCGR